MREYDKKSNGKAWSAILLVLCALLLLLSSVLLAFGFMGFENGDYPTIGNYGIYAPASGILGENEAVVVDNSLSLERNCPVVFVDRELSSSNRINVLYLYDWSEDQKTFELTDSKLAEIKSVDVQDMRGRAVFSLSSVGFVLKYACTLYGICTLLVFAVLMLLLVILCCRRLAFARRNSQNEDAFSQSDSIRSPSSIALAESSAVTKADQVDDIDKKTRINDELSVLISRERNSMHFLFTGEANAIRKLGKLITAAAIKKNAATISAKESFGEISELSVKAGNGDDKLIEAIIVLLKSREK